MCAPGVGEPGRQGGCCQFRGECDREFEALERRGVHRRTGPVRWCEGARGAQIGGPETFAGWVGAAASIRARTDGNPLLIRLLAESPTPTSAAHHRALEGLLKRRADRRALVTRRSATLSAPARELVDTASVFTARIPPAALSGVIDDAAAWASHCRRPSWRAGILRPGVDGLQFIHGLVHDAVYAELTPPTRGVPHRRAAMALSALVRSSWPVRSSGTGDRQPGRTLRPAVEWGETAAEHARRRLAHDEAVTFGTLAAQTAAAADEPVDRRAQLWLDLTRDQVAAGYHGASVESCHVTVRLSKGGRAHRPGGRRITGDPGIRVDPGPPVDPLDDRAGSPHTGPGRFAAASTATRPAGVCDRRGRERAGRDGFCGAGARGY